MPSTHINHLTPRVLDIDDLYQRMEARGITMIDEIQGPPDWEGPDVLLRQTSFKALAEERQFRHADGSVRPGSLRVRFGEVEQRGVALTARGRDLYDRMVAEVDLRLAAAPAGTTRVEVARAVWREHLPTTERELALHGLAFFTYRVAGAPSTGSGTAFHRLPVDRAPLPCESWSRPACWCRSRSCTRTSCPAPRPVSSSRT